MSIISAIFWEKVQPEKSHPFGGYSCSNRTRLLLLLLLIGFYSSCLSLSAQEEFPVRGFPTGEEVLNRKSVPIPQPDPNIKYNDKGFKWDRLSKVPAPGVHPRVVMSPEDIPRIREAIKSNQVAQKAWEELEKQIKMGKAEPSGHSLEGLYALVKEDAEYGKKAAAALVKKAKEVEKKIDDIDANHPYKDNWWASGMRECGIMGVAEGYDYTYNFMTDEQRDIVRKIISKGTLGRYNHGMEIPRSWRTWNWPFFSQDIVHAALAIEGEEGYEPRMLDGVSEAMNDFMTYAINPSGYALEGTTYWAWLVWTSGGTKALMAVARRQPKNNILTHPHLKAHADSLLAITGSPKGPWHGRGDASSGPPAFELMTVMKHFYPDDKRWDAMWQASLHNTHWDGSKGRFRGTGVLPVILSLTNEAMKADDGKPKDWWTKDSPLPLTFADTHFGQFGARTSWDKDNGIMMTFAAITYFTNAGHDGPDEGTFSLQAHGVNWINNGWKSNKSTPHRTGITINGKGQYYGVAPGLFLDAVEAPLGVGAQSDISYSYSYKIRNGRYNVLYNPIFDEEPDHHTNQWTRDRLRTGIRNEEYDPTPFSRNFWKYASTNYGLWMGEDRHPTKRLVNVPVERAFRSVSLIKGEHPYMLVVDDFQANNEPQLYNWFMPLHGGKTVVKKGANEILLHQGEGKPKKGDPMLLVRVLERGYDEYPHLSFEDNRIVVSSYSVSPDFKIFIYPHRHGDPTPQTKWNNVKTTLDIDIGLQKDRVNFDTAYVDRRPFGGFGRQTYYQIDRAGKNIFTLGGAPSTPHFMEPSREFIGEFICELTQPDAGQVIRYTTDGSEPTDTSSIYSAPIKITQSAKIKAKTFAPDWDYGAKESPVVEVNYTKVEPEKVVANAEDLTKGVELSVYELPASIWKGRAVDLQTPLMPDLNKEKPIYQTLQKTLELPRVKPATEMKKMNKGFYRFKTFFNARHSGRYHFIMYSCGPTSLSVGKKMLINVPGPYFTMLKDREGEVYLDAGLHEMEIVACDPVFFVSQQRSIVPFSIKVKRPDDLTAKPVSATELYRSKGVDFNIVGSILEASKELKITSQIPNTTLHYTLDGSTPTVSSQQITKPMIFNDPQQVELKLVQVNNGKVASEVIMKNIQVINRLPAIAKSPALTKGMVRQRFTPKKSGLAKDAFFDLNNMQMQEELNVADYLPDSTGGSIKRYEAWWNCPLEGTYTFQLPYDGVNQLMIDGQLVTSNHLPNAQNNGEVILDPGWHKLIMMYEASKPGLIVVHEGEATELNAGNLFRPRAHKEMRWLSDDKGRPTSFLLGVWLQDGGKKYEYNLNSSLHGIIPENDAEHSNAMRCSGDKSLILIRKLNKSSEQLTFAAWLKPEALKGQQVLLNRQNIGKGPYAQWGGVTLSLNGNRLKFDHKWHHPPAFGKLKPGVWQHVAFTLVVQNGKSIANLYLDGKSVGHFVHGKTINLKSTYLELMGMAERSITGKNTAELGYDELEKKNSFKGLAADIRLYDAALSPEAIAKLAGKK